MSPTTTSTIVWDGLHFNFQEFKNKKHEDYKYMTLVGLAIHLNKVRNLFCCYLPNYLFKSMNHMKQLLLR